MASGIFSIFDDVAALMDDVAVASKLATRKTAGILGDDLAVNAEKATGFLATRELPVLWAITKGSFINKLIIVPIALLLTAFSPVAIKVILVLGGFYLAYEGAEKVIEYLFLRGRKGHEVVEQANENDSETEKSKVRSAVTTDFILSVEIVIIALGTVLEESLILQIITVSIVSLLATVGVYGLVALIVRMDDIGFKLIKRSNKKELLFKVGHLLVKSLPLIIKFFGFIGTIALLLVSGGIFVHNIEFLNHMIPQLQSTVKEFLFGFAGGLLVLAVVKGLKKIQSVVKR
jgi:predicted DNA repair protein MutK